MRSAIFWRGSSPGSGCRTTYVSGAHAGFMCHRPARAIAGHHTRSRRWDSRCDPRAISIYYNAAISKKRTCNVTNSTERMTQVFGRHREEKSKNFRNNAVNCIAMPARFEFESPGTWVKPRFTRRKPTMRRRGCRPLPAWTVTSSWTTPNGSAAARSTRGSEREFLAVDLAERSTRGTQRSLARSFADTPMIGPALASLKSASADGPVDCKRNFV
jgi:hypothetical protein